MIGLRLNTNGTPRGHVTGPHGERRWIADCCNVDAGRIAAFVAAFMLLLVATGWSQSIEKLTTTSGSALKQAAHNYLVEQVKSVNHDASLIAGAVLTDSGCVTINAELSDQRMLDPLGGIPLGMHPPLVYLVGYTDVPVGTVSRAQVQTIMQTAQQHWYSTSVGRTVLGFTVVDWITTPALSNTGMVSYAFLDSVARARVGLEPNNFPDKIYILACPTNSGITMTFVDASGVRSLVCISGSYVSRQYVYTHERGHMYGLKHANSFNRSLPLDSSCVNVEYGENTDVMGYWNTYESNAAFRDYFGWLDPAQTLTVTQDTVLSIVATESASSGLKCIRVQKTWSAKLYGTSTPATTINDFFYISYRQGASGVEFHVLVGGCERGVYCFASTNLLKFNGQAVLLPGQSYLDTPDSVRYSVLSAGSSGAVVRIQFLGTRPPPPAPIPIFPANGATGLPSTVALKWRRSTAATGYRLQVSSDPQFLGIVRDTIGLVDTTSVISFLPNLTTYFWRVLASNANGSGAWSGVYQFLTAYNQPLPYAVQTGWNLISLPLTVGDWRVSTLYPSATVGAFAFIPGGGYIRRDSVSNGFGYWVKFPSGQTIVLNGIPRLFDTLSVSAGWNLIGTIAKPVAVASILQIPSGIVQSPFYGRNGGYVPTDTLVPGKAYWVKTIPEGRLVLGADGFVRPHQGSTQGE
jgi:hypothetical protein